MCSCPVRPRAFVPRELPRPCFPWSIPAQYRGFGHGALPRGGLPGDAVGGEGLGDLLRRGLDDAVAWISREIGAHDPGEVPAGPGAGAALGAARFAQAVGEMLVVHARVADEDAVGRGRDHPGQREVGQGMSGERGFVAAQIGEQGPISREDGPGGEAARPEMVCVGEAAHEETFSAVAAERVERLPVERDLRLDGRKMRAGREDGRGRGHGDERFGEACGTLQLFRLGRPRAPRPIWPCVRFRSTKIRSRSGV